MRRSLLLAALATLVSACASSNLPDPRPPEVRAPPATLTNGPALPDPDPEAPSPAEGPDAAYAALLKKIPRRLDIDRAVEPYAGSLVDVKKAYDDDFAAIHALTGEFETLAGQTERREITLRARYRQATLFDVVRQRLAGADPPHVKLYTDKEEDLLRKATGSGNPDLVAMAQELRKRREEMFHAARENWLQTVEAPMVRHYAEALLRANAWGLDLAEIRHARARFVHAAELLGDAKMKAYTEGLVDPANGKPFVYSPGALERP